MEVPHAKNKAAQPCARVVRDGLSCRPIARAGGFRGIIGTVADSSGAAVPNAKITITEVSKNVNFETTSNESGDYQQTHLIVGTYKAVSA